MKTSTQIEILRHSTAHVLAAAVLEMFPEAKFGMGPATDDGFFYDFELPRTLIPEDLPILEEKMKAIIKADYKFERAEISVKEATEHFQKLGQTLKIEIINDLSADNVREVSIYKSDHFVDLCSGPHLESTGKINPEAIKLTRISGAYWKSDEKNQQLQRIYGVAFETEKELQEYLTQKEEAEKRDHKKIGKELDLFSFHPEAPGSAFWHPKGMVIWNELEKLGKTLRKKHGYEEIQTPVLAKTSLWITSGHWDHYKDSMFHFKLGSDSYALKPMDCPFNIKIYQTKQRSYKDLPIRYSELGRVMRHEKSGELNGLLRVQNITQDDSHIFCTHDQVEEEVATLIKMAKEYFGIFSIVPKFFLSTRPEDFMGEIADWNKAEKNLENALKKEKIKFEVKEKDGAFYGPKIDVDIADALGRKWQLATIQLDFQLPKRFDVEYVDKDGKKKTPVMIHGAIFGALERFTGILLEHTAGKLPLWISPVQVAIIPVSEKLNSYAEKIYSQLLDFNIRVDLHNDSESLGKRIREAEKQKIPYMLIVGEKEEASMEVSIRHRDDKNQETLSLQSFVKKITKEIQDKK
jgi:threonyl-tRNA synthetase